MRPRSAARRSGRRTARRTSRRVANRNTAGDDGGNNQDQAPQADAPAEEDPVQQIKKYSELHEQGIISDEEFAAAKAKLIGT